MPSLAPATAARILLLAPLAGLCGCAVPVSVSPGASAGAEGAGGRGAGETIFLPEQTHAVLAGIHPADLPEYARRDGALAVAGADGPLLATSQWPQATRPDLDFNRYISLPSQPGTYLYFSDQPYRGWYARPYYAAPGGYTPRPWWR